VSDEGDCRLLGTDGLIQATIGETSDCNGLGDGAEEAKGEVTVS
jgi:hypothetical protein